MGQRTTLYRFYDGAGRLLYVGITMRLPVRLKEHEDWQPWWHEVVGATMEHFADRTAAERAEIAAIRAERPAYNVTGTELGAAIARRVVEDRPRRRVPCPVCGDRMSVMANGRFYRHNRGAHNEHGCLTYYGRCSGSNQLPDVAPSAWLLDGARCQEKPCEHDRAATSGGR